MLIRMTRSQRTAVGHLLCGVAYELDKDRHKDLLKHLFDKKFAEKTTKKQILAEAHEIATRQTALQADEQARETSGVRPIFGYAEDYKSELANLEELAAREEVLAKLAKDAEEIASQEGATDAQKSDAAEKVQAALLAKSEVERAATVVETFGALIRAIGEVEIATQDGARTE